MSNVKNEKLSEAVVDFACALEAACVQLKRYIGQQQGVEVKEETFLNLQGWEKRTGERIGEYEFTTRKTNDNSELFNHAFNILKANDATIKNHFSEKGWRFYYWTWPESSVDTIYRKERKA